MARLVVFRATMERKITQLSVSLTPILGRSFFAISSYSGLKLGYRSSRQLNFPDATAVGGEQGLDLIEPAADMGFGAMARRPRGPQAHGNLKDWTSW